MTKAQQGEKIPEGGSERGKKDRKGREGPTEPGPVPSRLQGPTLGSASLSPQAHAPDKLRTIAPTQACCSHSPALLLRCNRPKPPGQGAWGLGVRPVSCPWAKPPRHCFTRLFPGRCPLPAPGTGRANIR